VIASGACYFLPKFDSGQCVWHRDGVTSALVDEERTRLILAYQGGDLATYGRDGMVVWVRTIAVDGIRLNTCVDEVITAEIEYDYEGSWRTIRIGAADGADIG
jgi:hypothetical protein